MKRETYSLLRKHFRVVGHRGLPNPGDPSYPEWRELSSKQKERVVVTRIGSDNQ